MINESIHLLATYRVNQKISGYPEVSDVVFRCILSHFHMINFAIMEINVYESSHFSGHDYAAIASFSQSQISMR